ncbi:MAG TPA: alpha/beta hydrolase [Albitalea sp.]
MTKPVQLLRDAVGRTMLSPALRLMRAQLKSISDPVRLRQLAARLDALGRLASDIRTDTVTAGGVRATWIDVPGAQHDRVVLYLHGGAFVAETPVFHGALLARICREAGARGLMVGYRLAPEHRFPAGLDDCMAAYRWLLDQGVEPGRIVVAGDSAGGNLTLALLLRARDEGLPLPGGAVALSPVADLTFSGDSVQRNDGIDDMFSADLVDALAPAYLSQPELCTHPHVSPLFGDYTDMPPLLLIVGSTELLLDDAVRVAQRCPSAQLLVWHGMPHVFAGFDFLPQAREATRRIGAFVRECVAREPASQPVAEAAQPHIAATPCEPPSPAHAAAPRQAHAEPLLYLALAVVTGSLWVAGLMGWFGPASMLAHPALWGATAAVLVFMAVEAASVGWRRMPWSAAAAVLLGPGCGLSVFLFMRAARRRGRPA